MDEKLSIDTNISEGFSKHHNLHHPVVLGTLKRLPDFMNVLEFCHECKELY